MRFGACVLDVSRGTLTAPEGTETVLRPKTLELLRLLLAQAGRVVSRGDILDAVWPGIFVTDDSITQCVVELRRAMGIGAPLLKTVPRRGYVLEAEVIPEAAAPLHALPDDRPSIAVMPFRRDADADSAWFADGIIEGIVHVLSGLDRLTVISRGSALAVAEQTLDPREIGRRLGVRYVLQGGVRRAGGRLRVTTELSETETGSVLSTGRHEGEAADVFAIQDSVAGQAANTIVPQLRELELVRARRKPPESLTAYDMVLRALDQLRRLDRGAMLTARDDLQAALSKAPNDVLANSYLSWWYTFWTSQGWSDDAAADAAAAEAAAQAALDADPTDALALGVRGVLLGFLGRDVAAGIRLVDKAVSLQPSLAVAWSYGALLRCWIGEGADAVVWAERGVQLAPADPLAFYHQYVLGLAHYVAGDFDAAARWGRSSLAQQPRHMPGVRAVIAAEVAAGRTEAARASAHDLLAMDPTSSLARLRTSLPMVGQVRESFIERLRQAGVPP
jgi:adenylate cyclase